jgi:hypothetical protein
MKRKIFTKTNKKINLALKIASLLELLLCLCFHFWLFGNNVCFVYKLRVFFQICLKGKVKSEKYDKHVSY